MNCPICKKSLADKPYYIFWNDRQEVVAHNECMAKKKDNGILFPYSMPCKAQNGSLRPL